MLKEGIPGMSVALVDDSGVLWASGFGTTDELRRLPVTTHTIFGLQSCSKTFTATIVLLAVQDRLLDLDLAITSYLPRFRLRSRFEDEPESRITLRHLLSHKAGLTHEAPIGNNYEFSIGTSDFDAHIDSITRTWLRYPVGQRYAYSNLGCDLAGYILQVAAGMPFGKYAQHRLFNPLGMDASSFDLETIAGVDDRALGHDVFLQAARLPTPLTVPMIPAGGLYASVDNVAKFLIFHLNQGRTEQALLLKPKYLHEMTTIPFPMTGQTAGYALGVAVSRRHETCRCAHGGGGFGFLTDMIWYPGLKVGIAVLTNSSYHRIQWNYANQVLDRLIDLPVYHSMIPQANENLGRAESYKSCAVPTDRLIGLYVGRIPDAIRVLRHAAGLAIAHSPSNKPQPLVFTSDDQALVNSDGGTIRYRFVKHSLGRPSRLECLDNGAVFDYNDGPHDRPGSDKPDWRSYIGTYMAMALGAVPSIMRIRLKNGHMYLKMINSGVALRLDEHQAGLFFTSSGEAVEFCGDDLSFAGIIFYRIGFGTELKQWLVLGKGACMLWRRRVSGHMRLLSRIIIRAFSPFTRCSS